MATKISLRKGVSLHKNEANAKHRDPYMGNPDLLQMALRVTHIVRFMD
jgi:hypothetical protein